MIASLIIAALIGVGGSAAPVGKQRPGPPENQCGACGRPFLAVVSQQPPFNVAFVPDTESARLEAHGYYAEYES